MTGKRAAHAIGPERGMPWISVALGAVLFVGFLVAVFWAVTSIL